MFKSYLLIGLLSATCAKNILYLKEQQMGQAGNTVSPSALSSEQWAIYKVKLNNAWDISTGLSNVNVGIIDSGIRGTHEDLSSNVNTTLSTVCSNVYTTTLEDTHGHGTHVAGIIGANGANDVGIAGVCWNVSLIDLRAGYIDGGISHIYNSQLEYLINYASDTSRNIGILNLSYYNFSYNSNVYNAINSYPGLFVCIAGNDSRYIDTGTNADYPASYHLNNMIVVGNSDEYDERYSTSNYGASVVDIFAPGTDIKSTYMSNDSSYINMTGTSMAAPLVTGTAALLKSINPTLTTAQIKAAILDNADQISSLNSYCPYGRRLNAYKSALAVLPTSTVGQTINSIQAIPAGGHQWYKISGQPGGYQFLNSSSLNLSGSLYTDIQGYSIASGSSNGSGILFSYAFSNYGTYYLKITNNSSSAGSFSITYNTYHVHNYNDYYIWSSNTKHIAFCECGASVQRSHIVQSGGNTCLLCGGYASGGPIGPLLMPTNILTDSVLYPDGVISLGSSDYYSFVSGCLSVEDIYGWDTL